jgi:hypothetical protein
MHAVVVDLAITELDADLTDLRDRVVPRLSEAPGFVTGYWTRKGSTGLSLIVFDSEEAANSGAERVKTTISGVDAEATIENIEVREVVAHA